MAYEVYKANKTMEIMGKQEAVITNYYPEIKDIIKAYRHRDMIMSSFYRIATYYCTDLLGDFFNLGMIYGIRKERARRKNKKPRQCANIDRAAAVKPTTI